MIFEFQEIKGGVTAALGFDASGVVADIKGNGSGKLDLGVIYSREKCVTAGVFTTNTMKAAPVKWDIEVNKRGNSQLIITNSGNANASTGKQGLIDVEKTAIKAAELWNVEKKDVFICSTGVIGEKLPVDKILNNLESAKDALGRDYEENCAKAIMTTDLTKKSCAVTFDLDGKTVTIGGIAKGSGMIHPNMATMLAYFTTDINISKDILEKAFKQVNERSFNSITIDGDTSTNDTAIVLANGLAGNRKLEYENDENFEKFTYALSFVAKELAKEIAKDGEGATKFITITVRGLPSFKESRDVAKKIAESNLVKTAFFGNDPNWGRILMAAGNSGVDFDPDKVEILINRLPIVQDGVASDYLESEAVNEMKEKEVDLTLNFHNGTESATVWTCDFSYDYVKINADYRT